MKTVTYLKHMLVLLTLLIAGTIYAQKTNSISWGGIGGRDVKSAFVADKSEKKILLNARAKSAESEGTVLTYSNGNIYVDGGVGVEADAQLSAAMRLPSTILSNYVGAEITKINFGISKDTTYSNVSVVIWREELADNGVLVPVELYSQKVDTIRLGWNQVTLKKPFSIDGQALFIGYSFFSPGMAYPISFDRSGSSIEDASYVAINGSWTNSASEKWGALNIMAVLSDVVSPVTLINTTPTFTDQPEQEVSVQLTATADVTALTAHLIVHGNTYSQELSDLSSGETRSFTFEQKIAVKENESVPYTIQISSGGKVINSVQGNISRSASGYDTVIETTDYGMLYSVLTQQQRDTITTLCVRGFMNSSDFELIKNNVPNLKKLDLSAVQMYSNSIPRYALSEKRLIEEVILPTGITSIEYSAFGYCNSLKIINLPEGLLTIDNYAFQGCTSLSGELILPSTLRSIGSYAFQGCVGLNVCRSKAITPPAIYYDSIESIATVFVPEGTAETYRNSDYWSNKIIIDGDTPVTVTVNLTEAGTLGEKVLEQVDYLYQINKLVVSGPLNDTDWNQIKTLMTALISVDFSAANVTLIPDYSFNDRSGLQEIQLPKGITAIGHGAFSFCKSLAEIEIPETVNTIGNYAFQGCVALRRVILPAALKVLGTCAFLSCNLVQSIVLPEGLTVIENQTFRDCLNLRELSLPESLRNISYNAFYQCTSLSAVKLPSQLVTLGNSAFYNCPIDTLTLPATLTAIESSALRCSTLKQITCLQPVPPVLTNDPFEAVNKSTCELIVPSWAESMYKLANVWNQFANVSTYEKDIDHLPVDGVLTLPETVRPQGMPSVTILPTGKLTVRGNMPFATNRFAMNHQLTYRYWNDGFASSSFSNLVNESSAMTAEAVEINASVVGNQWFYLSFPYDVALSDVTIDEGKFFVFRKYDGASRASIGSGNSWTNVAADEVLRAGTGFIFQCNTDVANLKLKATEETKNQLFINTIREIPLTDHASENPEDQSWNLVGNPFPSFFDIHYIDYVAPITIWNGNSYEALSLMDDQRVLRPFEAFFVQKPNSVASINFLPEGRQTSSTVNSKQTLAQATDANSERKVLNLLLGNESYTDKCRVVINPLAKSDYEMTCDAAKFMSTKPEVPQLYSLDQSGISYAINERPEGDGIVSLGFYAGKSGGYTLSLPVGVDKMIVTLVDKITGAKTDLNTQSYSFDAPEGLNNERFELHIQKVITGTSAEEVLPVKLYSRKGALEVQAVAGTQIQVIAYTGILLKEVSATDGTTEISLPQGTYMVVINGKTYKAIVL